MLREEREDSIFLGAVLLIYGARMQKLYLSVSKLDDTMCALCDRNPSMCMHPILKLLSFSERFERLTILSDCVSCANNFFVVRNNVGCCTVEAKTKIQESRQYSRSKTKVVLVPQAQIN